MTRKPSRFDLRQSMRTIGIVLGVLAAINLVFYLVAVQPIVSRFDRLSGVDQPFSRITETRATVETQEGYLEAVQRAKADLSELNQQRLSTRKERMVDVERELARLCEEFGIDLLEVSIEFDSTLEEGLERMTMDVPLEGGYRELREFLQAVEQSDEFLVVEAVALTQADLGGNVLSLSIMVTTYFQVPQERIDRSRERG